MNVVYFRYIQIFLYIFLSMTIQKLNGADQLYYKSIEFNLKHAFQKMKRRYKCKYEIKEMFQKRYPL